MPAEWAPHTATWIAWPELRDLDLSVTPRACGVLDVNRDGTSLHHRYRIEDSWPAEIIAEYGPPPRVRATADRGGPGTGWDKADRDSESMAVDPASGRIWVGFENYNALWRYAPGFARAEARARPRAMADWPVNGGPESLVRLRDGRFIVLGETAHWPHSRARAALLFAGDPVAGPDTGFRFSYAPPAGYDPSDAAELPDGDLLVLNRRFALPYDFTAILTIVPRAGIAAGKTARGMPIAGFAAPLIHDNFEGVAVTREGKQTIVWLVSDDNQSLLQRSLLLKFRLEPDKTTAPPRE